MYNLKEDISESKNLSKEYPKKTVELLGLLHNWRKSVNAPVPDVLNPNFEQEIAPASILAE